MKINTTSRRSFIKFGAAITALPSFFVLSQKGFAQEAEKLSETDGMALALGYKEDTTQVDAATYPNHSNEQVCLNCALYQGEDPEWGACAAVGNKLVAGQGWCVAYSPKQANS
ncbi:MAG: high-potential iron-sulfur protein [Arenicella sp.]|jgi:hypothetical protein|nr:high-potential iron-sulfur protein [Arenicella sp.]